jgi:hypothetical protein
VTHRRSEGKLQVVHSGTDINKTQPRCDQLSKTHTP